MESPKQHHSWLNKDTMCKISFLLPTKRDWREFGSKIVDDIYAIDNPLNFTFEILVASPNVIDDERVTLFADLPNGAYGVGGDGQINYLASQSKGDYLAVIVDYCRIPKNYLDLITFLESSEFAGRKFIITSPATNEKGNYPYPELTPFYPELLDKLGFNIKIKKFKIICFPILNRQTYEKLGNYIFHPHLRHASDWYLSFYLNEQNEEAKHLNSVFFPPNNNKTAGVGGIDPIVNNFRYEHKFGEWYVNLYRLIKSYLPGDKYIPSLEGYLSEEEICNILKEKSNQ